MQQQRMGVVVIGQSPRPSVVDEIAAVLSPGLEIDLLGALDGMTMRPGSDAEAVDEAARKMSALSPDLVVMDCMSYTRANKARVRLSYGGPVILAIAAAARAVEELVA